MLEKLRAEFWNLGNYFTQWLPYNLMFGAIESGLDRAASLSCFKHKENH